MIYSNIQEGEIKNKVAQAYFAEFDCTKLIGNIDFCVSPAQQGQQMIFESQSLLWAEAKKGSSDIYKSIVQLILTIGKARTFDKVLPPSFLGAFDAEKMAFIPYSEIHSIFYQNDFNWNVAPSNHETKEFKQVHETVKNTIDNKALLFYFGTDDIDLQGFIKTNFIEGKTEATKIKIDKNNFMIIYNKWLTSVKPTIAVNWELAQKKEIIDGDFYLADLLSEENETIKDTLYVLLKKDHYELDKVIDDMGFFNSKKTFFKDNQKAHTQFWNRYERPPKEEYQEYIKDRRDLLVPQDVRERKGSFYTPQIWVELSQKYLADTLGEDWQDEYYIWDCAAGTGNLLAGLTNKYNIFASTLDRQDVDVMKDRIENGANLAEDHVFQFDFLNDEFSKLPKKLQEIINDEEKRKKLVIYINPPYAEAGDTKQRMGEGKNKDNVSNQTLIRKKYATIMNNYAQRELFIQFFIRVYAEIQGAILAEFSTLKMLQAPYFAEFRGYFLAELCSMFVIPSNSFDNVKGKFPIGFMIWNTDKQQLFNNIKADIYHLKGRFEGTKRFYCYDNDKNLNEWLRPTWEKNKAYLGYLTCNSNDFQNSISVFIQPNKNNETSTYYKPITTDNLILSCIYLAVRKCIEATWLNDRDQFLYPKEGWKTDTEFQNDCLAYTLFHGQNRMTCNNATNHWIPFSESAVNARGKFDSDFMTQFIKGKLKKDENANIFGEKKEKASPLIFSTEAQAVFQAGLALWKYYHAQKNVNVNASLYDIRAYFQGRNEGGKMKNKSEDETYTKLIEKLREELKLLAQKIEPKVYEFGFLKG